MSATIEHTSTARTVDGREVPVAGTYALDASHSRVGFVARHLVVAKSRGEFSEFSGTVVIGDDPLQSSVNVEIDIASVNTNDAKRDEHLRSSDFFAADDHPKMHFRSTGVRPGDKGRWVVSGELTVKDVTRTVDLEVEFDGSITDPWGGSRAAFSASAEVNREDFGLTWNQALEGGGVLVGKHVAIEIEAEAVLQA
ncbi:MAG: YceI family protein [Acidimicrobiia bacterium]